MGPCKHGSWPDDCFECEIEQLTQTVARLDSTLTAVKLEIVRGCDSYCEKVIHLCGGPAYQFYVVPLAIPDPLPEGYSPEDTRSPRLTIGQAVDRWVEGLLEEVA